MTIYDNIFLGHEIKKRISIDENQTIQKASAVLKKMKVNVNPSTLVKDLGVGVQQLIEIAKALNKDVKLLILDEPTAALNEIDSQNLLTLIRELKGQGVTSIMISHKLKEIISIADTITILRDGKTICSLDATKKAVCESEIIKNMVGREIDNVYPKRSKTFVGERCLEIKDWTVFDPVAGREIIHNVSLNVNRGEIVGISGLMGAGRTELALSIFGNPRDYKIKGELLLNGKQKSFSHIQDIKSNITMANLKALSNYGVINENEEVKVANEYKDTINIKTPSVEQTVGNLSGGNQQKVSLCKSLFVLPNILILDEPTRGIDVGAKYEIYTIMNRLVEEGMSIIMISSDILEVIGMSDRIYIIAEGRVTGKMSAGEATEEKIMEAATI